MLQRLREHLTIALIALLPFHALMVTVLTRAAMGPGHAPLAMFTLWKEVLLFVILVIALMEWFPRLVRIRSGGLSHEFDRLDVLFLVLLNIAVISSAARTTFSFSQFFFGMKYDFVPLAAFVLLRRVSWSDAFQKRVKNLLLILGGLVALYGIDTFFLPQKFFSFLGYSDMHSLYLPGGPLAAFQQIGGTGIRRIQSTFSGPNQFGLWLLLPFGIALQRLLAQKKPFSLWRSFFCRRDRTIQVFGDMAVWGYLVFLCFTIFLTFSRSTWLAVLGAGSLLLYLQSPEIFHRRVFVSMVSGFALVALIFTLAFPGIFFRMGSTRGHLERPLKALHTIFRHPMGMGLGSAGPAANRTSDPCVFLEPKDDLAWWRQNMPNLCVFQEGKQIQPASPCRCPFLPENWYLQIGVEMGVLGLAAYLAFLWIIFCSLVSRFSFSVRLRNEKTNNEQQSFATGVTFVFIGISIAGLFLHAWEDSAVAYTAWVLMAAVFSAARNHLNDDKIIK